MSLNRELISRSVVIEGHVNPVAYDEKHKQPYGYWLCKQCGHTFSDTPVHVIGCEYDFSVNAFSNWSKNSDYIYVMGPKEGGILSKYNKSEVEKIKALAKTLTAT